MQGTTSQMRPGALQLCLVTPSFLPVSHLGHDIFQWVPYTLVRHSLSRSGAGRDAH